MHRKCRALVDRELPAPGLGQTEILGRAHPDRAAMISGGHRDVALVDERLLHERRHVKEAAEGRDRAELAAGKGPVRAMGSQKLF
jgi:hypothetical protein